MASRSNFNWGEEELVIPQVDAVAVYENTGGEVVIRQRDHMGDEDSVIVVPRSYMPALLKALEAV